MNRNSLRSDGYEVLCHRKDEKHFCRRILVERTVAISPGQEIIVPGRPVHKRNATRFNMIEPSSTSVMKRGLIMGRTFVDADKKTCPLRIMNLTNDTVTLNRGTRQSEEDQIKTEMPEHLKDLYKRSTEDLEEADTHKVKNLLLKYQDTFAKSNYDLGRTGLIKHEVDTGDAKPINHQPRRLSPVKQAEADRQIKDMLERDIIEPSTSPWSSPITLVTKKNGSIRFCLDYRRLNEVTIKDCYPLSRIDDSLDCLRGSKWFATLDLASGYWQVELGSELPI
jgi:hypothetical protein